jgi:hypothetical protein
MAPMAHLGLANLIRLLVLFLVLRIRGVIRAVVRLIAAE